MPTSEWLAENDTVRVTQDDCNTAVASNQYNCAIVCAIQRKYPTARRVRVNAQTIAFSIGEERFLYPTPESAVESIIKPLDTGGKPEPGLVRLTGGLVRPVVHPENPNDAVSRERARRRLEIAHREVQHQENIQARANYGRFNQEGTDNA